MSDEDLESLAVRGDSSALASLAARYPEHEFRVTERRLELRTPPSENWHDCATLFAWDHGRM